ncbi:coadhesin-like [Ruditapes philippinarum]|uniref:coadhesin-like n=1 Tax=Ruditapes philippinarum TaxID=129788 RepID=UPI00295ACD0E|nr:coadhesin-like [Ruditapes philippinarum]
MELDDIEMDTSRSNNEIVYENLKISTDNSATESQSKKTEEEHYETLKYGDYDKRKVESGDDDTVKRLKYVIYVLIVLISVVYITLITLVIVLFVPKEPVDGRWAQWTSWTTCDVTCGNGKHLRLRTCTNPVPMNKGSNCIGESLQSSECSKDNCPVNGQLAHWSSWTSCDVTCGKGSRQRSRTCTNPVPANGGHDCTGAIRETDECSNDACPGHCISLFQVDGQWAYWSSWTSCDVTCGNGRQLRTRRCTNPMPEHKGKDCLGESLQSRQCSKGICPTFKSAFSVKSPNTYSNINEINKLTFSNTIYQYGNDFSISTGTYTCSKSGVYHFSVTLVKKRASSRVDMVHCFLYKNRQSLIYIGVDPTDDDTDKGHAAVSQSIAISLDVGDTVFLTKCSDPSTHMEDWSSFTGFLLYDNN